MKTYHHIPYYGEHWDIPVIAFDKLDGTNIRVEYSHKRGFYKFGTRKTMFDERSKEFGFVVPLFKKTVEKELTEIFKTEKYRNIERFLCYFEVLGEESEFGQHNFEKEFDLVLIDVDRYKKGFVAPREFVRNFSECGIPRIIYDGNLSKEFVKSIKENTELAEGVVCKGLIKTKKGIDQIYHCKIKTDKWLDKLKGKDLNLYNEEMKDYEYETNFENEFEELI